MGCGTSRPPDQPGQEPQRNFEVGAIKSPVVEKTQDVSQVESGTEKEDRFGHSSPEVVTYGKRNSYTAVTATSDAEQILQVFKRVAGELNPERATELIITEACTILEAERGTIFTVVGDVVRALCSKGPMPAELKPTTGIPVHVAKTGLSVVTEDAYSCDLFDQAVDVGFENKTKTLLCVPIADVSGKTVAVLELVNKTSMLGPGVFTSRDATLAQQLAAVSSICIRNCETVANLKEQERRAMALLDLIKALSGELTGNSLMFTVCRRAQDLFDSDKCTFFVVDEARDLLWSMTTDSGKQIRQPLSVGIVGTVASTCKGVNIADAYLDERFNREGDQASGYRTKSMLCAPICSAQPDSDPASTEKRCTAVLQLVNKRNGESFTQEDEKLIEQLCDLVGDKVEPEVLLQCFQRHSGIGLAPMTEGSKVFPRGSPFRDVSRNSRRKSSLRKNVLEDLVEE